MKIKEIQAKTILNHVRQPDDYFGLKYNMNLYRGCQHRCIYCDSRSLCYQIEDFDGEILVKVNAPALLADALPRKRVIGTIGFGSMNDPYMPVEKQYRITEQCLEIIARNKFPIHIITKSDLMLQDIALLIEINKLYCAVTFTITTADDNLCSKIEPGSPVTSRRLEAMRSLSDAGILTGISLMPILPYINDNKENIRNIIQLVAENGGKYVVPGLGVSIRDRQREYLYKEFDKKFPGVKQKYIKKFGGNYSAPANDHKKLQIALEEECYKHNIALRIPKYTSPQKKNQLSLL
jgi:DNA repair photolyase